MPEPVLLLLALGAAFLAVLRPLRGPVTGPATNGDERSAAEVRHRAALEAVRDVEADHRSGSLDPAAYETQRAEAESRAVETRAALDALGASEQPPPGERSSPAGRPRSRVMLLAAAATFGLVLVGGSLLPATGIGSATVVNEALAEAETREAARQDRIGSLLRELDRTPEDPDLLSDLADEYLAGSTRDDLALAATLLQAVIELEPDRADAYERIIAAYVRAGDYANGRAAHRAYGDVPTADPVELAFFDGLIALRGEGDRERAVEAFDRFLELAPDDPRAEMISGLRDEAAP